MKVSCDIVPKLYKKTFELLAEKIDKENVSEVADILETLAIELKDCNYKFYLKFTDEGELIFMEEEPEEVDGIIITDSQMFHKLALKELNEVRAYMTGKIKIEKISPLKVRDVLKKLEDLDECYREALESLEEE